MLVLGLGLSSCRYQTTFSNLQDLDKSKEKVESISNQELNPENQVILRNYFSKVKSITYDFLNNTKMQQYTHRKFLRYFKESICNEILLDVKIYNEINSKCTVNNFYICSEEVRSYTLILKKAKELFNEKEINKFISSESCKAKLLGLGVINE
jgi:hypothetical protein